MSIIHRLTLTVLFTFLAALPGQPVQSTVPLAPEQFSCTSVTEIPQSECEALVDLYEGADGPNWINNDGWLATTTPCSWHGVTCSGGSVSQLHFFSNGLSSLPPQIGNLTNLTELFLVSNQLGILPPEIGNLTNLTELSLSYNRLSSLPSEIGNLTNLMGLFLISNQLSSLPPEIGNLTNLTELSLSDNRLSSLPPEIGNLTNLMRLSLGDDLRLGFGRNQLSSLPPEIGNLINLTELDLDSNQLSSLPPEIGNLTNLTELFLISNELSSLPPEIGNLNNLTGLSLSANRLSNLPPEIGNLANLTQLGLSDNELSSLPPEIGNLNNLTQLDLDFNQLSSLPAEVGNLTSLTSLELDSNQLSSLPPQIGNLNNLMSLSLFSNQLNSLPPQIGNLNNLTSLSLAYNRLVVDDDILRDFIDQADLDWTETQTVAPTDITVTVIDAGSIELIWRPILFQEHGGFYEISIAEEGEFTVHGTTRDKSDGSYIIDGLANGATHNIRIRTYTPAHAAHRQDIWSDPITIEYESDAFDCSTVSEIPQLECEALVSIYNNTNGPNWADNAGWLSTTTPCSWFRVTCNDGFVTQLALYGNNLSDAIPSEIGYLTNLTWLDLSENQLSSLPSQIGYLKNLARLNLHQNQLSSLPTEIGNLTKLTVLTLSKNQLSSLPTELWTLTNLTELTLGTNLLSTLPTGIGNLTNLTRLNLHQNQLSRLPPEIWTLTNLTELTLGINQLSSLPPEIDNLTKLTMLTLDANQLSDLPDEIGNLINLTTLHLGNNQLSNVTAQIGNLTNLATLHLNNNRLSDLPSQIGNLTSLTTLNLNNNQLTSLPSAIGNLASMTSLNLNNNQLTSLSDQIGNLTNLEQLGLDDNQLSSLPAAIGNLASLTSLNLNANQLTSLPLEIGNLASLTSLNLNANQLTSLPLEIGDLTSLASIELGDNQLSRLPAEIGNLTSLEYLELGDNQLSSVPAEIGSLTNLVALLAESNQLSSVPAEIGNLTDLIALDLESNQLNGLPLEIGDLDSLSSLNLAYNRLIVFDHTLRFFLGQHDPDWEETQTPVPTDIIQGSVWNDENGNGIRDGGELGLAGISVRLQSSDNCTISMTTTTDTEGGYIFSGLVSPNLSYIITFEAPDGTIFSPQDMGGDDTIDSDVHPNTGQSKFDNSPASGIDAGIIDQPSANTGGITGTFSWYENGNGICGATVQLLDADRNALVTSVTDADGDYAFVGLQPEDYIVKFVKPGRMSFVNNALINPLTGETGLIAVLSDEIVQDIDAIVSPPGPGGPSTPVGDTLDCTGKGRFDPRTGQVGFSSSMIWNEESINLSDSPNQGIVPPPGPPGPPGPAAADDDDDELTSIKGSIWIDINGDSKFDDNAYKSGVTVICKCAPGVDLPPGPEPFKEAKTNEDGDYEILDLRIGGTYIIEIQLPPDKILTNSDGDSDINPVTKISDPITLTSSSPVWIDAGLIQLGDVDCNGLADSLDSLFVLQKDVRLRGEASQCPPSSEALPMDAPIYDLSCDVDGNGTCNLLDALFILRCQVRIPNILCPTESEIAVETLENKGYVDDYTQDRATISIAPQNVSPGSIFTVTLMATVDEELGAAGLDVVYDPSQFKAIDCQADQDGHFGSSSCNIDLQDRVSLGLIIDDSQVSGTLRLADITFEHIGTELDNGLLSIDARTFAGPTGNPIEPITQHGVISIGHRTYLPLIQR